MTYTIYEMADGRFGVYEMTSSYCILVKSFKTRKAAESWISKH